MKHLIFLCAFFFVNIVHADPKIPPQLESWVPWILDGHPERLCAVDGDIALCAWPGNLSISLSERGGDFVYRVVVDNRSEIALPGDRDIFPQSVSGAQGGLEKQFPVMFNGTHPYVVLNPGQYLLKGRFSWEAMPESLRIPDDVALVQIKKGETRLPTARVLRQGEILLNDGDDAGQNYTDLQIFRRFVDGNPLRLTTLIHLRVSGKASEITLGKVLPEESTPYSITSSLTARLLPDNSLQVVTRPGEYDITVEALYPNLPKTFTLSQPKNNIWPKHELWSWKGSEQFRSVILGGVEPASTEGTRMPPEWQDGTIYHFKGDQSATFEETRRGVIPDLPSRLNLSRNMWLTQDGSRVVSQDMLSGALGDDVRMNVSSETALHRVESQGRAQLITKDPKSGASGVEVRDQNFSIQAETSQPFIRKTLTASGWEKNVESLGVTLHVPNGWEVLHVKGPDVVSATWVSKWNLLDVFLIALVTIIAWKFGALFLGGIALLTLLVTYQEPGSAQYIWFHLFAGIALIRFVTHDKLRKLGKIYFVLTLCVLIVYIAAFSFDHIHHFIFPTLNRPRISLGLFEGVLKMVESGWSWPLVILLGWITFEALVSKRILHRLGGVVLLLIFVSFSVNIASQSPRTSRSDNVRMPAAPEVMKKMAVQEDYMSLSDAEVSKMEQKVPHYGSYEILDTEPGRAPQTGIGLPAWTGNMIVLSWTSPVSKDETFSIVTLNPFMSALFALLKTVLLILFGTWFVKFLRKEVMLASLILISFCLSPSISFADDFPSKEILSELEARLFKDDCRENCVTWNELSVSVKGNAIELKGTVSSRGTTALTLPGPVKEFVPEKVILNNEETAALRRDEDGFLRIRLSEGAHSFAMLGTLDTNAALGLQFPMQPMHVSVEANGWTVNGVSDTGSIDSMIQLIPEKKDTVREDRELPNWYAVTRIFDLGVRWTIQTKVTRIGDLGRGALVRVPLVEGESVTSQDTTVRNKIAEIAFNPTESEKVYESTFEERSSFQLKASTAENRVTESWQVRCSSVWRCSVEGIPAVSRNVGGKTGWKWEPYPNESVKLSVIRPDAIQGGNLAFTKIRHVVIPGNRITRGELYIDTRATESRNEKITLPDGSTLTEVTIRNTAVPIKQEGTALSIPFPLGEGQTVVRYELTTPLRMFFKAPHIEVPGALANVETVIRIPQDRWLWWVGGSGQGPRVLFWSHIIGILLLSVVLARYSGTPLSGAQWFLLSFTISVLPMEALAIPILFLILLRVRKDNKIANPKLFNFFQVALGLLAILSISVLLNAIRLGLLFQPGVEVIGGYSEQLSWYVDYTAQHLLEPFVISASLFTWRAVMLAWSLWLVFAVIRWARWGFECFSTGGVWKAKEELAGSRL